MKNDLKENFKAEVIKSKSGLTYLRVTHNGYQFTSIRLNHDEMVVVIEVLKKELGNEWQRLWREG